MVKWSISEPWKLRQFMMEIGHEITMKVLKFVLNSMAKVKPVFYFPQCVYFLNQTGQNPNLTAFISKIQVFCRPEWEKARTPWKLILTIFKWKNEFPRQVGFQKQMKKMVPVVWFSYLLLELWSLKGQKLCPFCVFLLTSATNLRLLK